MPQEKKKVSRRAARILGYLNATSLIPTPEIVRREQRYYGFTPNSFFAEMFCDQRFAVDYTLAVLQKQGLIECQLLPEVDQVDLESRGGHPRSGWKLTDDGLRCWIQIDAHNRLPFFKRLLRPIPLPVPA